MCCFRRRRETKNPAAVVVPASIPSQETVALQELTKGKAAEEEILEEKLEKASLYMKNVRSKGGEEWDGSRVEARGTVEQLQHKV